jgi:hypothetical protein
MLRRNGLQPSTAQKEYPRTQPSIRGRADIGATASVSERRRDRPAQQSWPTPLPRQAIRLCVFVAAYPGSDLIAGVGRHRAATGQARASANVLHQQLRLGRRNISQCYIVGVGKENGGRWIGLILGQVYQCRTTAFRLPLCSAAAPTAPPCGPKSLLQTRCQKEQLAAVRSMRLRRCRPVGDG